MWGLGYGFVNPAQAGSVGLHLFRDRLERPRAIGPGDGSCDSTWPSRTKAVGVPSEIQRASWLPNGSTYRPSTSIVPPPLTTPACVSKESTANLPPTAGRVPLARSWPTRACPQRLPTVSIGHDWDT
jgi:hypothetical protein